MPVIVTEIPIAPPPPQPPRKRWTREECAALEASGIWEQQHLELVEGELISKMGKKRPHTNTLTLLLGWAIQVFGLSFINPEAPIDVAPEDNPTNEPEPDIILLNKPSTSFRSNPRPEDVALLVEVADSSRQFDLSVKARLYARAGIVEYWVADLTGRRIYVHRSPRAGAYEVITVYSGDEVVSPLAASQANLVVSTVFPESPAE